MKSIPQEWSQEGPEQSREIVRRLQFSAERDGVYEMKGRKNPKKEIGCMKR